MRGVELIARANANEVNAGLRTRFARYEVDGRRARTEAERNARLAENMRCRKQVDPCAGGVYVQTESSLNVVERSGPGDAGDVTRQLHQPIIEQQLEIRLPDRANMGA